MPHSHVPALSPAELELALQELERLTIPEYVKKQIRLILIAASNPDSESVEASIASLPPDRQQMIADLIQRVQAAQRAAAERDAALLALLALVSMASFLAALFDFFSMGEDSMAQQAEQLLNARQRIWLQAISDEARESGVSRTPRLPSGNDLETLRRMSAEDAKSISDTYNKDLQRQIEKLRKANPNGDARYFIDGIKAWVVERALWKAAQIALNTETQTREYARSRFAEMNYPANAKYRFMGPPPTCKLCLAQFGAGSVDFAHTRRHPCPIHINCPHYWAITRKIKLDPSTLWMG